MIDPPGSPGTLERLVRQRRPALAGVLHPGSAVGSALRRPAAFGILRIGSAEPRLARPLDPVVPSFREHEMRVGVVRVASLVGARVNRERVRQVLLVRELTHEVPRQFQLFIEREVTRQREVGTDVEAPVGALVEIRGIPESFGIVRGPRRHLPGLGVEHLIEAAVCVFIAPRDVVECRLRGCAPGA
jgi:hypothetical protein